MTGFVNVEEGNYFREMIHNNLMETNVLYNIVMVPVANEHVLVPASASNFDRHSRNNTIGILEVS